MSTGLTITRQNGNVPKTLAGQDHISGFIAYMATEDIPAAFKTEPVQAVSTIDTAEALGISADAEKWSVRVLHYHLSECFRQNKGISLYLGIFVKGVGFKEVGTVQRYAGGAIRQMAIWDGATEVTSEIVTAINAAADELDMDNAPLSVLYAPKVTAVAGLPTNLAVSSPRVSVVIAQAGSGLGAELYADSQNKGKASVSAIGVALGCVSRAAVHQSIAWVREFPSGISTPAFGDGTLVRSTVKNTLEKLDTARYLFLTPIVGIAGSYWNDSHNMDSALSDYSMIESVRTMDKAVRGIRTYLTPELGGNVYIDAESGKMESYTVEHLTTTANIALEEMEKAGELSGYAAEIDPEQNVLASSTVEIVIKNVPVGVVRRMKVKIGYVKSL